MISFETDFSTLLWAPYQFVNSILEDRGERKSETSHSAVFGWNSNRERISHDTDKGGPWQMEIFMFFFLGVLAFVGLRKNMEWSTTISAHDLAPLLSLFCLLFLSHCYVLYNQQLFRVANDSDISNAIQRSTFRRQSDTSNHALSVMDQTEFLAVSQPSSSAETATLKRPLLPTMAFWSTRGP